ncbi:MAG: hypothetical protein OXI43_03580 [Candidatus Poribacteria bacterium]|nr:hypothetical protein [Candidatus Poribacteria bacterium]
MLIRLNKDKVEHIAGFLHSVTSNNQCKITVTEGLTSDEPKFYRYIEQISNTYFNSTELIANVNNIHSFLILIHNDLSADIYINDFIVETQVRLKRNLESFEPGTLIMKSDITDIYDLSFPNIEIQDSDSIICCLKVGWKFLLYFDFLSQDRISNITTRQKTLARLYRYLSFEEVFRTLESKDYFKGMISDGWFPFVEILSKDYKNLTLNHQNEKSVSENEVKALLDRFDESRIKRMTDKWWEQPLFQEKQELIQAGIDAFLGGTKSDYINCIKTLYSEIEGIMRSLYLEDSGERTRHIQKLIDRLIEVGERKVEDDQSLLLPQYFSSYLVENIFKEFDPETGEVDLSRHTALHGVALVEDYKQARALQALLTLDQIYFYLPTLPNENQKNNSEIEEESVE